MMAKTGKQAGKAWIVVASQDLARIYGCDRIGGELRELQRLEHREGTQDARDLKSDRPGRAFDSLGQGRHSLEPPTDPKVQEAIRFSQQIAGELEEGRVHDRFAELVLVAGPEFLGRLRHELSEATGDLVVREIGKNLSHFEAREIREHLASHNR